MTLTTVIGSSGSGKTTFLNDVYKRHRCTYIRQYHSLRPYILVSKIPNFDPSKLPYWEIFEKEAQAMNIRVGGTMAGEFTSGLSGGQRKMLLFELLCQRVKLQKDLLIVLDEPFAGVTDDFVPFIVSRLEEMRENHNVLLVTNDHIKTLTEMANNIITVSAIDRSNIRVNERKKVDREKVIDALSIGKRYQHKSTKSEVKFFVETELRNNATLFALCMYSFLFYTLFLIAFWESTEQNAALVITAAEMVVFFSINPYLLSLVDWRITMIEESEALLHTSTATNKNLKMTLVVIVMTILGLFEYVLINSVMDGMRDIGILAALLCDNFFMNFQYIALGIFTNLSLNTVQIVGNIVYISVILFSSCYSPGSGFPIIKDLRYLFPKFYFWCMVPAMEDQMEGCPVAHYNMLYLFLTSLTGVVVLSMTVLVLSQKQRQQKKAIEEKRASLVDKEYFDLREELCQKSVVVAKSLGDTEYEESSSRSVELEITFFSGHDETIGRTPLSEMVWPISV